MFLFPALNHLSISSPALECSIKHARLLAITFIFTVFMVLPHSAQASGTKDQSLLNCDIQEGSCTQPLQSGDVTLEILPKPVKAMADLVFQVTFRDISPTDAPFIDLGMPGMKMGPNRVLLKKAEGSDTYSGRGIIVRCPSGRTIWKATVTVPGAESVEFVFDVIY